MIFHNFILAKNKMVISSQVCYFLQFGRWISLCNLRGSQILINVDIKLAIFLPFYNFLKFSCTHRFHSWRLVSFRPLGGGDKLDLLQWQFIFILEVFAIKRLFIIFQRLKTEIHLFNWTTVVAYTVAADRVVLGEFCFLLEGFDPGVDSGQGSGMEVVGVGPVW